MARNKGTFNFAANFQVKMQEALDPRIAVATKSDLITKETFPYDGDTLYLYNGLLVSVADEKSVYMLVDIDKALSSDYSGWLRVDAGNAKQIEVVDNLESDASDKALSAKQGKVLLNEITTLEGKLAGVYTYKGSKAKYEDLPTTDLTAGDVWNVEAAHGGNAAGTNYAWTGTEWDALAGIVDLSNYYDKPQVNALLEEVKSIYDTHTMRIEGKADTNASAISTLQGEVGDNKTALESVSKSLGELNLVLNGKEDDSEDGLVGRLTLVEDKNSAQDTRLTNLEKLVSGGEAGEGGTTLLEMVNKNTTDIAALTLRVKANEDAIKLHGDAIELLNAGAETAGSVDYKIKEALEWQNVE